MKSSARMILATTLAACFMPAWPQDLGQRVTFSSPAKRLDVLAYELTQRTGVPIQAHRDVAKEVVAVQVRDVALSELLRQIAAVSSSEVGRDGRGGVQLRRSREMVRRQEREALTERAAALREGLQAWETRLNRWVERHRGVRLAVPRGADHPFFHASEETPIGRAIIHLALLIRPEQLAEIQDGDRVVFSTHPNRIQVGLDPRAGRVIANLVQEQQQHLSWQVDMELHPALVQEVEAYRLLGLYRPTNPMTEPVKKALLVVSTPRAMAPGGRGPLRLELRVYDGDGEVMLDGRTSLGIPMLSGMMPEEAPAKEPEPHPHATRAIQLSPLARSMQQFIFRGLPGRVGPPPPEVLEALRRPDLIDPHSLVTSEATMAVAQAHGLQLVANFPDSFVPHMALYGAGDNLTVGYWERILATSQVLEVAKKEGWMLIQPSDPVGCRAGRIDRQALARLIHATEQAGAISLEALAEYAALNPAPGFGSLEFLYLEHWGARMQMGVHGLRDWELLRFYGLLSSGQRELLAMGRPIGFATLNPAQRTALERLLFRSDTRFEPRLRTLSPERFLTEMIARTHPPFHRSYRNEPTELMPNGVPREGFVTLEIRGTHILRPVNPDGSPMPGLGLLGLEDFALYEASRLAADAPTATESQPAVRHAQIGSRRVLSFTFEVTPDTVLRGTLLDETLPLDAPVMALDAFPQDLAAQFRRYREAYGRLAARINALFPAGNPYRGAPAP